MAKSRTGVWIIGAAGGVATTVAVGRAALANQLIPTTGLITAQPPLAQLDLVDWQDLILGGHEIRRQTLVEAASALGRQQGVVDHSLIDACRNELSEIDARIRPGTTANCGQTIEQLASAEYCDFDGESPRETITRLQDDLRSFQQDVGAEQVIVVNLASTEPPPTIDPLPASWDQLDESLHTAALPTLPASSLYAIAALDLGWPFINFTPSLGSSLAAIQELAVLRSTCHAGCDGKTGETMLKTALAPMFSLRNLEVMSWVGHNIFGNLDGKVLDDPINKSSKVRSKDRVLEGILGYQPQTLVSIEYIESMGEWKTAWDHIHFRGFLGTPMVMQFTWQGCDSILAAPLVLDLIRLVGLAHRRGEKGVLTYLSCFFKSPLGTDNHDLFHQFSQLTEWAHSIRQS